MSHLRSCFSLNHMQSWQNMPVAYSTGNLYQESHIFDIDIDININLPIWRMSEKKLRTLTKVKTNQDEGTQIDSHPSPTIRWQD